MPRAEGQKAKLLVLKQIFERKTDEEHMLSVPQLLDALEKAGMPAERKSIYSDIDALRRGGVENCDAVAAVSEDDSVNLMAAQIAKNIFRREKVICRVSDPHLQVLYHKTYELDTICPTILTEQAVFRALAK